MAGEMNILVSANDRYAMPLAVLLQSLLDTNPRCMTIYLLSSELSAQNRETIERLVSEGGSRLVPVSVGDGLFQGLPTLDYISRETYFRLLAADLLPTDVDRILWLDADMVVNGDIFEFYCTGFNGAAVVACPHGAAMRPVILENCTTIGIEHPDQYFNAGVMLMNLDAWRQMGVAQKISRVLSAPREMRFPGQDLTNLVFDGRVKTADWRVYNCMVHSILPDEVPELRQSAKIIHYVGRAKPWQFVDVPLGDVWKSHYDKSPYAGIALRRTSYARMRQMYERMRRQEKG